MSLVFLKIYLLVEKTEVNEEIVAEKLACFEPEVKKKGNYLTLTYKKKGLIFDSTKEVRLLFNNPDLIEKFMVEYSTHREYVKGIQT